MKKILVIAIVCLLGSFAAAAQTVKVNGTIVDEQNRPVEFVNVALISLPDSSFVTESTTDGKGKFALRATAGSDFLLRLSYIGYVGEQIVIRTPRHCADGRHYLERTVGSTGRGGNIGQQYHAEGRPHGCSTHRYCHEEFL